MVATQTFRNIFAPHSRASDDPDYVICHDHLYSPHGLLSKADGAIVERYDYDAYGQPAIYTEDGNDDTWFTSDDTTAATSAKGLPYLFTGREFNPIDGAALKLQYSRARYYSFSLLRWFQRNLIGYAGAVGLEWAVAADPATPKLIGARTSGHFT